MPAGSYDAARNARIRMAIRWGLLSLALTVATVYLLTRYPPPKTPLPWELEAANRAKQPIQGEPIDAPLAPASAPPASAPLVSAPLVSAPASAEAADTSAALDAGAAARSPSAADVPKLPASAHPSATGRAGDAGQPAEIPGEVDKNGYKSLSFAAISEFEYSIFDVMAAAEEQAGPDIPLHEQIPKNIRALNGRKVSIEGFIIPIEQEREKLRTFLLVKSRAICCFGVPPRMNEWIYVEMRGERRAEFARDVPALVSGELEVGEEVQDGIVMSIYRMKADAVVYTGGF